MPVMFMLLQKLIFDGKFQICQISLLPTDSVILDHTVLLRAKKVGHQISVSFEKFDVVQALLSFFLTL
jgi:hypothetical protein